MQIHSTIKIKILIFLFLLFTILISALNAQDKINIAGKMIIGVTDVKIDQVEDTKNHQFMLVDFKGDNFNIGKHIYMDSSQVTIFVFEDRVVKDNDGGLQKGYIKFSAKNDTVFAKFDGKVKFTLSDTGSLITSFGGIFSFLKGTGQYENIKGKGTYKGSFISKGTASLEWSGEFYIAIN
jgi:hypothetical protein